MHEISHLFWSEMHNLGLERLLLDFYRVIKFLIDAFLP